MPVNLREGVVLATPRTSDEREAVAGSCVRRLRMEIPALVDEMDDTVERAYTGWPDRLYVIDREGRVAYKSAPGPYGFSARGLAGALERIR